MAVFIAAEFKIFIGFRDIYNCYKLFVKILRKVSYYSDSMFTSKLT